MIESWYTEWRCIKAEKYFSFCFHLMQLAEESDITIAKMDATANDVAKPYEVSG